MKETNTITTTDVEWRVQSCDLGPDGQGCWSNHFFTADEYRARVWMRRTQALMPDSAFRLVRVTSVITETSEVID